MGLISAIFAPPLTLQKEIHIVCPDFQPCVGSCDGLSRMAFSDAKHLDVMEVVWNMDPMALGLSQKMWVILSINGL